MRDLNMPFLDTDVVTIMHDCPDLSNRGCILSNFYHTNKVTPLVPVLKEDSINTLIEYFTTKETRMVHANSTPPSL